MIQVRKSYLQVGGFWGQVSCGIVGFLQSANFVICVGNRAFVRGRATGHNRVKSHKRLSVQRVVGKGSDFSTPVGKLNDVPIFVILVALGAQQWISSDLHLVQIVINVSGGVIVWVGYCKQVPIFVIGK